GAGAEYDEAAVDAGHHLLALERSREDVFPVFLGEPLAVPFDLPRYVRQDGPQQAVLVHCAARPPERQPHRAGPQPLPDERLRPGQRKADVLLVADLALELMPSHAPLPPSASTPAGRGRARARPAPHAPVGPRSAAVARPESRASCR